MPRPHRADPSVKRLLLLGSLLPGAASGLALTAAVAGLAAPGVASAQTSTGTLRGTITGEGSVPAADVEITARNVASGFVRRTTTRDDGTYVFAGLVPGQYDLNARRIGYAPANRRVIVQVGATEIQNFALAAQATQLTAVTVTGTATVPETRTSEVATNVTPQQIQKLPTSDRNFLDLASLAPGVTVTEDRLNGTTFRTISADGQSASSVNLFIDGTSLKNDLTAGGIAGQDASRGNPFPRNAVQEYRVISQNFKAEYQDASSAIITATTKSGGNTWSGNALVDYQNKNFVALDYYQLQNRAASSSTFQRPDYSRTLTAFSIGGPIVENKVHVFGSYEGNYQDRSGQVNFGSVGIPTGYSALDTVSFAKNQGTFGSPFRENLFFGKIDASPNENSYVEFNASNRTESEVRDFGSLTGSPITSYQSAINYRQNVSIAQVKYNYFKGAALNEAKLSATVFRRDPTPNDPSEPSRVYINPGGATFATLGSNTSAQDFTQRKYELRDDFTYTGFRGLGDHVFKTGASVNFVRYNIYKDNNGIPQFSYAATRNCNPSCADTGVYNYAVPFQLQYGSGDPRVKANNTQVGLYAQDDWTPVRRLTFNVGIRWDYETNMLNNNYATPQFVVDTLNRYNSQLVTPLDPARYVSTGNNRKPFAKEFQPRFGFSYALDERNRTTVFGGWGLYYDRLQFDLYGVDPYQKIAHPTYTVFFAPPGQTPQAGQVAWDPSYLTTNKTVLDQLVHTAGEPEAWFIDLNAKVPRSRQMNLGVRQLIGSLAATVTYANVRGYDQMALNWANFGLKPDGSCCASFNIGAHGFANFIYSTSDVQTWYQALQLQLDRPYQRRDSSSIGWGAGLAYSHAWRYVQGVDNLGDEFSFPNAASIPKHPSNDERDHLVANAISDIPYAFGIQASALLTLGGRYRLDVGCPARFCGYGTTGNQYQRGGFIQPGGPFPYRTLNLRFRKDFPRVAFSPGLARASYGITLDIFNVTNRANFGCYNVGDRNAKDANGNPTFGTPTCVTSDPRRFQLGAEVNF